MGVEDIIYYNLKGKEVKHVKQDGEDIKKIVLTKSKKTKDINTAIDNGYVINIITEDQIGKIDEIYSFAETDKTFTEKGFLISYDNKTSQIYSGSKKGKITYEDMLPAKKELGNKIASSVHLHPLQYDEYGNLIAFGIPVPSEEDKDFVEHFPQPSMILGFKQIERDQSAFGSQKLGGNNDVQLRKMIGFFQFKRKNYYY
jgi:hypothetical protein